MQEEKDLSGEKLIDRLYKDLHLSKEVMRSASTKDSKEEKIREYFNRMERIHTKAFQTGYEQALEKLRQYYYDHYVIKEENIKESYFLSQQKMAIEEGRSEFELTEATKAQLASNIIQSQQKSLDELLNYFSSEDAMYPMWAKYWAFQGLLQLGTYEEEKQKFSRRTKSTIAPFQDLNKEALSLCVDEMQKYLSGISMNDTLLKELLENGSFVKLYTHIYNKLHVQAKADAVTTKGQWVKYPKQSDPEKLVQTLQGYGTSWCTVGYVAAELELKDGDFYVYYSYDKKGQATIPRIAIRMRDEEIREIRGVAPKQGLEPELEEILEQKLKEFKDKDRYRKKCEDMKRLTRLSEKQQKKEPLTKEELLFLYEIEAPILSFGYQKDPRIEQIKKQRDLYEDIACIFDCEKSEIGTTKEDLKKPLKVYLGDLEWNEQEALPDIFPSFVIGNVTIAHEKINTAILPEKIIGNLTLPNLTYLENPIRTKEVTGDVDLQSLTSIKEKKLFEKIGGNCNLKGLVSLKNIVFARWIGGNLLLNNLREIENVTLPEQTGGSVNLSQLISANHLKLSQEIGGSLFMNNLISAKTIIWTKKVKESVYLNSLFDKEDLEIPSEIGESLELSLLIDGTGLKFPQNLRGNLDLGNLEKADGVVLPKRTGGSVYLNCLPSTFGMRLPEEIEGDLYLLRLATVEGFECLPKVKGNIYMKEIDKDELEKRNQTNIILLTPSNQDTKSGYSF